MSKAAGLVCTIEISKVLAVRGDMFQLIIFSLAGSFEDSTPAGQYLLDRQAPADDFNSNSSRHGKREIMTRGTFVNIRVKNEMPPEVAASYTKGSDDTQNLIYDAARAYQADGTQLVVFGGASSSGDFAAKNTVLPLAKAVNNETFERIHWSNLVGMGAIPYEFTNNDRH